MADETQLRRRLNAIEEAISSGATSVSYEGKTVSYRDLVHLRSVRDEILRQLGEPVRGRRTVARFSNGF